MAHFVTRYDFRAPGADPATRRELFGRAVEQAAYLDAQGEDALMLSEHHAADDGYLPSPIPVAAAFAAVTSRVPITVSALLANFYDPVRLAEEIAVLVEIGRLLHRAPEELAAGGRVGAGGAEVVAGDEVGHARSLAETWNRF